MKSKSEMKRIQIMTDAKRRGEIRYQWACYKSNPASLTKADLACLREQAKKYGVKLS